MNVVCYVDVMCVVLRFDIEEGFCVLCVVDNGCGVVFGGLVYEDKLFGLIGICECVYMLGGIVMIDIVFVCGFLIIVVFLFVIV